MTDVVICGIALLASLALLVFIIAFSASAIEKLRVRNESLQRELIDARRDAARFAYELDEHRRTASKLIEAVREWESTIMGNPK